MKIYYTKLLRKMMKIVSRGNGHCEDGEDKDGKPNPSGGSGHCS